MEIKCPMCRSFVIEIEGEKPTTPPIRTFCYARTHAVTVEVKDGKVTKLVAEPRAKKTATA